jgi:hypothetical protein
MTFPLLRVVLAVVIGLFMSGCAVQPPPPTADQLRAEKQHRLAPLTPQVEEARAKLLAEFREFMVSLYPDYNGIQVEFQGNVYGNEYGFFYATHPFFTKYEFAAGPRGPLFQQWLASHRADFLRAHVTLVGLRSSPGEMGVSYSTGADPPNSPNYIPGS